MEYEFTKDAGGTPVADFSMGHEAVARWLTDELGSNPQRCMKLLEQIENIENGRGASYTQLGANFELNITGDDVIVTAHDIDEDTEFEKNTSLYELESNSECGLIDFKEAVQSWLLFIERKA